MSWRFNDSHGLLRLVTGCDSNNRITNVLLLRIYKKQYRLNYGLQSTGSAKKWKVELGEEINSIRWRGDIVYCFCFSSWWYAKPHKVRNNTNDRINSSHHPSITCIYNWCIWNLMQLMGIRCDINIVYK